MGIKASKANGTFVAAGRVSGDDLSTWYYDELKSKAPYNRSDKMWPDNNPYQSIKAASYYFTQSPESPDKTQGK